MDEDELTEALRRDENGPRSHKTALKDKRSKTETHSLDRKALKGHKRGEQKSSLIY